MSNFNRFGVIGLTVRLHNDFDNIPEFQYECSELKHMVLESKMNRIKVAYQPDRWVCDSCYNNIFKDAG